MKVKKAKKSGEKLHHDARKRRHKKEKVPKVDLDETDFEPERDVEVKSKPRRKHGSRQKERAKG